MPKVGVGKTTAAILAGEMDLTAWDEEELLRGQRKNKNGKWSGRAPKVVPKAVHDELVRRKMSKAHDLLRDTLVDAVKVWISIANDTEASDADRLKASQLIVERVLGRAPEKIQLDVQVPAFIQAITDGIVSLDSGEEDPLEVESWEVGDDAD